MRLTSATVFLLLATSLLAACGMISGVTETEKALCVAWRDSLPTRSSRDTQQTQDEIGVAYDVQAAACPDHPRFE